MANREFERIEVKAELDMSIRKLNSPQFREVHLVADVSYGGMRFFATEELPLNEDIEIRINFENDHVMRIIANVKRCNFNQADNLYDTGVEFITISGTNLKKLTQLFEQKSHTT